MFHPSEENVEEKCLTEEHIKKVKGLIDNTFPSIFNSFLKTRSGKETPDSRVQEIAEIFGSSLNHQSRSIDYKTILQSIFDDSIKSYETDVEIYRALLNTENLEMYAFDKSSFKTEALQKECPVIRMTLKNRRAKQLDRYRKAFKASHPNELHAVVSNISQYAFQYIDKYNREEYEISELPEDFQLHDLEQDACFSIGVIGGGIKSHFLYKLNPEIFPNRSQDAMWALWFLTEKSHFDCKQDSEFLRIHIEQGITNQNYYYPYSLFSVYALYIWKKLSTLFSSLGCPAPIIFRYVLVDSFLSYIADQHRDEIDLLKTSGDENAYA